MFATTTTGKWILAGEHAVLRGVPALVFPLLSKKLILTHKQSDQPLKIEMLGQYGSEIEMLCWGVLEKACAEAKMSRSNLRGELSFNNSIPIGAGLGASAALCVAITQWFSHCGWITIDEQYEFARQLENLFHGESSGVDISIAMNPQPIRFMRGATIKHSDRVRFDWRPRLYLTYSGKRGVTSECVNKVKNLISENQIIGKKIDDDMLSAVLIAEAALQMPEDKGFLQLAAAIELAQSCFVRWGLVDEVCRARIHLLHEAGARAVKMTGSGAGGYILSLWDKEPADSLMPELISCL